MKCTFYGVCGSYPGISKDIKNFNHTSCVVIETEEFILIFDAGSGIIELGHVIHNTSKPIFLTFSHFHYDHIIGLPFFSPIYEPHHNITIIYPQINKMKTILPKIFNADFFPVPYNQLPNPLALETPDFCNEFGFNLTPIKLNHPGGCYGYRFTYKDICIIYATDNQITPSNYNSFLQSFDNCNLLIHDCYFFQESQSMLKTWGHTFLNDLLKLSLNTNINQLCLFHLKPDIDQAYLNQIQEHSLNEIKKHNSPLQLIIPYDGLVLSF